MNAEIFAEWLHCQRYRVILRRAVIDTMLAPVFGCCDRCCQLFWREEWLEEINGEHLP
jgi:hypothetical protein